MLFVSYLFLLTVLCRKDTGFRSAVAYLAAGFFAVSASIVILFSLAGALPDLVYANVVWPLTQYNQVN